MRDPDEFRRWFEQAEDDLRWAKRVGEQGGYNIACFLAQQAAEKALQALLFHQGEELIMSHSVRDLCERAATRFADVEPHCIRWGSLDQFYLPTRYPDTLRGSIPARFYGPEAASGAVNLCDEIMEYVRQRVSS